MSFNLDYVDLDAVVESVRNIAKANPDHVYSEGEESEDGGRQCFYERNGHASCIVGRALHANGVSVYNLKKMDEKENHDEAYGSAIQAYFSNRNDHRLIWLDMVQSRQDALDTWSSAVSYADECVTLRN